MATTMATKPIIAPKRGPSPSMKPGTRLRLRPSKARSGRKKRPSWRAADPLGWHVVSVSTFRTAIYSGETRSVGNRKEAGTIAVLALVVQWGFDLLERRLQDAEEHAAQVAERFGYSVRFLPVGPQDAVVGPPTQMGGFDAQ